MNIKIVADSLCDISEEYIKKYDIDILPLTIIFGNVSYRDGVDITKDQFYEKLKTSEESPKTSQVNPSAFLDTFEKYPDRRILYVGSSSKASGTYQSGFMAKNMSGRKDIETFDTMSLSLGSGLQVAEAGKMAAEGKSFKEIIERLTYMKAHMKHVFTVDTLEYLERGGRISKAKSILGTVLSIKPILTVEDGIVVPLDSARGKKKVNEKMIAILKEDVSSMEGKLLGLSHAQNMEDLNKLKEEIIQNYNSGDMLISEIGAGVGTHCGPGTIAMFYLMDEKTK